MEVLELMAAGLAAGTLGAMLGIGGGVLLVPILVLWMGIPLGSAIPASLMCVVAGSCGAASRYVRNQLSDVRLALPLELATVSGALVGGVVAAYVPPHAVGIIFGLFCLLVGIQLWTLGRVVEREAHVRYTPVRYPLGVGGSFVAGSLSALLGVGGGPLKVPLMTFGMKVPFKVAAATSNFMVGVTAAASLVTYAWRGALPLALAAPLVMGVLLGSAVGTRLMLHVPTQTLKRLFAVVVSAVGIQMLYRGGAARWIPSDSFSGWTSRP
jgi:uncharacterized protein